MRWPKDPTGSGHPRINRIYRWMRRLSRSLMSVWFREINIVDDENIPPEGELFSFLGTPAALLTQC